LAGLQLNEVVCMPALSEKAFLDQIHEDEKLLFENSRTGNVAERYKLP
jgi:hypothetical protein